MDVSVFVCVRMFGYAYTIGLHVAILFWRQSESTAHLETVLMTLTLINPTLLYENV